MKKDGSRLSYAVYICAFTSDMNKTKMLETDTDMWVLSLLDLDVIK